MGLLMDTIPRNQFVKMVPEEGFEPPTKGL